ncbi:FAD-dependent oxidoreductase [Enhygromyxa salina]|uniref:Protoporphyrinogen oxidase n=1 Tax=Enhygromyxa salina TaxID=215803 RepID=A0A2S9XQR6_9BACT|nr:FAD-dependent oxidoreductase [Enhygromyxa salina]PRP95204.1 protoporphyrinogen oxidase [Enhygromyxa salina]
MNERRVSVGVVGGGIAGCGAAWALDRAGFEVELFEASAELGGNAKTIDWQTDEGQRVTVGLSVLAWPPKLFRNYCCLLATLGIETQDVELRMFIRRGAEVYTPGLDPYAGLAGRHADDLRRWRAMIRLVRRVNRVFNGRGSDESIYHFAPLNPMNVIRLWALARGFGISRAFWDDIVVAWLSAFFLTTKLDRLPAVMLPTITDIMPLEAPASLQTWRQSSREVFEGLTAPFADRVHTGRAITRIESLGPDGGVELGDASGARRRFDKVVLACSAPAIDHALIGRRRLHDLLIRGVRYCDESDPTFNEGVVHGDPTVIRAEDRNPALAEFCNVIDVSRTPDGAPRYENHFVLSSWVPAARDTRTPMLVSYNSSTDPDPDHVRRIIDNRGAHPELCTGNLVRALLYRFVQGKGGMYFCGSYATPGNGHDLSLLSGLVVAAQIGAPYPFASNAQARADFERLRRIMLGR